jgi:Matrixin
MADQRMFDINSRPRVYVNWDSFVAQGIPTSWQWPFVDAVVNAYTRWMTVAGAACRFRFEGFTTKTNADAGEVVISMNERRFNESRLASAFGSTGGMIIVFHRKNGANLTDWPFVPYNASPGEYDMQGILMHELGHTYWLDHSSSPQDVMWGNYSYHYRFGPYEQDVQRVKALYGDFAENRLRLFRSSNGGSTWISTPTAITSYNHYHARTTSNAGVAPVGSLGFTRSSGATPTGYPHGCVTTV